MNKKMEEVKEANIRVVSEDFLQDVSASTKSLQELFLAHILSPWGAEVKAEPVEVVAPRGKSGAALSKKSKGQVKEEGEGPKLPPPGPKARDIGGQVVVHGTSPFVSLTWPIECCRAGHRMAGALGVAGGVCI